MPTTALTATITERAGNYLTSDGNDRPVGGRLSEEFPAHDADKIRGDRPNRTGARRRRSAPNFTAHC